MARTLYSSLLFSAAGFTGPDYFVFAPPGEILVLRDLDAYGNMSPFQTARLYLMGDKGQTIAFLDWPGNDQSHKQWTGRQVIPSGSSCIIRTLGGGPLDVTLSGYTLSS